MKSRNSLGEHLVSMHWQIPGHGQGDAPPRLRVTVRNPELGAIGFSVSDMGVSTLGLGLRRAGASSSAGSAAICFLWAVRLSNMACISSLYMVTTLVDSDAETGSSGTTVSSAGGVSVIAGVFSFGSGR